MSQLLVAMDVDPSEVMEIEEPYDTGYVPASAKLKQLYDAAKVRRIALDGMTRNSHTCLSL
jgi:hypothetical protein